MVVVAGGPSSTYFTCYATQPVAWVSLGISGVNHSHGSYVAFDCDTD